MSSVTPKSFEDEITAQWTSLTDVSDNVLNAAQATTADAITAAQQRAFLTGGITILAERELFAICDRLRSFPASVRAIAEFLGASRKPLEQVDTEDVECWNRRS